MTHIETLLDEAHKGYMQAIREADEAMAKAVVTVLEDNLAYGRFRAVRDAGRLRKGEIYRFDAETAAISTEGDRREVTFWFYDAEGEYGFRASGWQILRAIDAIE